MRISLHTLLILFIGILLSNTYLQAQLDIEVYVDDYDEDTLYMGYYYGNKKYFYDTLTIQNGHFHVTSDSLAPKGFYLLLNKDLKKYHDLILESDQEFIVKTDSSFSAQKVNFEGSDINTDFYEYIDRISTLKPQAAELQQQLPDPRAKKALGKLNEKVERYQNNLIDSYPGTVLSSMIKSSMEMDMPEFEGSEQEVNMKKYRYFKAHYFDDIDIGNEKLLRAPFFYSFINRYVTKVTPQHPDSIIQALDRILQPMYEDKAESFKFFLIHYLNHFAKSKIVGMDAVYVHLVNEYYKTGKAWWTNEEQLKEILSEVKKIEPTLIGKMAPEITLKSLKTGEPINLYDIESPYTVLMFWDPECGHCKKSMPDFIKFYEDFKDKGVQMIAVCTKLNQDAQDKCLEYIRERDKMEIFINAYDPFLRSRYKQKYDIRTTPKVFILDDQKKIIMKGVPAEKMSEIMDQIMSADANNSG